MYDRIIGDIIHRSPTRIVVQTGGVGYEMEIPVSTYEKIPPQGKVEVLTHLHVREDQMKIFGFATETERTLFRLLLSVSGIGPSVALTILSGSSVPRFARALEDEDISFLASIKGIGKKRAQRLALELKDSVSGMAASIPGAEKEPDVVSDAVDALVSLGYKGRNARAAVEKAFSQMPDDASVEDLIRTALGGV